MLIRSESLIDVPVMSLQTGGELARVKDLLVDPRNLTVVAYTLTGHMLAEKPSFLLPTDIREISSVGIIVDSSDEFVGVSDVLRIQEVHDYDFSLNGIEVIDEKKHKLGKVHGYVVEADSLTIEQLNVHRPILKSFNDSELLVHRSQVLEVGPDQIIVKSTSTKQPARKRVSEIAQSYSNPFRSQNPQPETMDVDWPGTTD